jgi:hypothetical protein
MRAPAAAPGCPDTHRAHLTIAAELDLAGRSEQALPCADANNSKSFLNLDLISPSQNE